MVVVGLTAVGMRISMAVAAAGAGAQEREREREMALKTRLGYPWVGAPRYPFVGRQFLYAPHNCTFLSEPRPKMPLFFFFFYLVVCHFLFCT